MSSLSQALFSSISKDHSSRELGLRTMTQMSHSDPSSFLLNLSLELANNTSPPHIRQLAGLMLKNTMQNATKDPMLEKVWDQVDSQVKTQIRNNALGSLASEDKDVRLISSQTVATLACFDIPQGQWLDVLDILITNATNLNRTFKISALRTLGYICDGLSSDYVAREQSNMILTAIASSLDPSETDFEIKSITLSAFRNSLKFIKANMQNLQERTIIMNLIYSCCQDQNVQIRSSSMMIICDILRIYYDEIESNLIDLGNLTYNIIRNDHENVGIFAVEFWNEVADEEIQRIKYQDKPCKNYIETAAASLIPLLLEKIHLINEDLDEWVLYKACSSTLGSIAGIINDKILDYVGNYIATNLNSEDWHMRAASALIVGSIAESLTNSELLVKVVYSNILKLTADPVYEVKQNASWTVSMICEYHINAVYANRAIEDTFKRVFDELKDHPKIAVHACWTVVGIFSTPLSKKTIDQNMAKFILEQLITATGRNDINSQEYELGIAIWTAVIKIFEETSDTYYNIALEKLPYFLNLLNSTVNVHESLMAQSQICSVFHAIFIKTQPGSISDNIAQAFVDIVIKIFNARGTVIEEALQALGALASNIEIKFSKYFDLVMPFLNWSLECSASSICKSALMMTGDFSRALGKYFDNCIENILPKIFNILTNQQLEFDVKVRAIETLTDISSYCTLALIPFLPGVLKFIDEASIHSLDLNLEKTNIDYAEHLLELREGIMSFYVGLALGLNDCQKGDLLLMHLEKMVDYGLEILKEQYRPNANIQGSFIGLIGDTARFEGNKASQYLKIQPVCEVVERYMNSSDLAIKEVAYYADLALKDI
ncbi:hypothetical protein SteCoe_12894 [Stentor coeruleus]|uniref:Importin N-terminal domain-containing protein n=1 Tax=Stentor coeruleus TaxID=5963 RepID=A0A1R2C9M5_9CILI|nr:hypothetical protein SteCoe_12894 [Stentor coeruleus]